MITWTQATSIEVDIRLSVVLLHHIVSLADLTGFWHVAGYTAQGSLNLRYHMMPAGLAQHHREHILL
jgi:hypothetical protein